MNAYDVLGTALRRGRLPGAGASLVAVPRVGDPGRVPSFRSFEVEDAAEALESPGEAPAPAPLPWDIERRVQAKAKVDDDRSRARVELIQRRRGRKKELLRSLQLAKLRQRLTTLGSPRSTRS